MHEISGLTHGRLIDKVSTHDLAILFILNFRAMFGSQIGNSRGYELALFRMFDAPSVPNSKADEAILEREKNLRGWLDQMVLENKYKRVVDNKPLRSSSDMEGTKRTFKINEVANELSLAMPPDLELPFPALVIGTFWLSLREAVESTSFLEDAELIWVADLHQHTFSRYFDEAVK